jgi:copper(I)-binding protein
MRLWMVVLAAGLFSPTLVAEQSVPQPNTGLEFENVWIRAMPPFQPNSAGYLTLTNHRETAIAIVSASSNVSEETELHTTRKVDGLMRMEQLDGLAVAPGERVDLAPGGTHLMLLGLAYRPVPGDDITLCFELASEEKICTPAEVRRSGNSAPQKHEH